MKEYKVGDTIYLKAFVANVDKSDPEKTYGVNFVRGIYGVQAWPDCEAIIDELPVAEPVKPIIPKDVADELEDAKKTFNDFYAYLDSADRVWQPKTYTYVFSSDANRDAKIKIMSDAWYNGYTVEKELVYNLILGFDPDESDRRLCNALYKNHGELSIDAATDTYDLRGDDDYQFTQEEIDKYNKNFWIKNIDLNDYKKLVADD